MFKNSGIKNVKFFVAGFTLIELQVYLGIMALMAIMVCHVALMYHQVYDKIAVSGQDSVMMLAAIFQVNSAFDHAVMYKKKDGQVSVGSFLKKNKLVGVLHNRQNLLLDGVTHFDAALDIQQENLQGATFTCDYKGKHVSWYRAAFTKAFSCSSSL
jgi:hypothetical protein